MTATLLDLPIRTPETFVPCTNGPALQRLEQELRELRREVAELRCDVGYSGVSGLRELGFNLQRV